jgi:hypothetical protein
MTLPVVKFSATSLAAALVNTVIPTTNSGEGGFLKYDGKNGGWLYGRDQEAVDDEVVLVNTASIGHGWVVWVDSVPTKRLTRFNEPMPEPMDPVPIKVKKNGKLVDDMAEPMECRIFQGAFLEDGEGLTFETSTYGGRSAFDTLLAEIKQKAISGSEYLFPAIKLEGASYYNKTYKTDIHNPVFTIVSWHDQDGTPEEVNEAPSPEEIQQHLAQEAREEARQAEPTKSAPVKRTRTAAAKPAEQVKEEAKPEPTKAEPVRRRRNVTA